MLDKAQRLRNYRLLRSAGFSSVVANRFKDYNRDTIHRLIMIKLSRHENELELIKEVVSHDKKSKREN